MEKDDLTPEGAKLTPNLQKIVDQVWEEIKDMPEEDQNKFLQAVRNKAHLEILKKDDKRN